MIVAATFLFISEYMKTAVLYLILLGMAVSCTESYSPYYDDNNGGGPRPNGNDQPYNFPETGDLLTYTSEDWDHWEYEYGDTTAWIRTWTSESWQHWEFNMEGITGDIRTWTSGDWDHWELNCGNSDFDITTYTSNDWDHWEIEESGTGFSADVMTWTSNDFDHWEVFANGSKVLDIHTWTSEDWDHWEISGSQHELSLQQSVAVLFIPVFTSSVLIRGINQ